jgi:uncharacterized Zn-finger protein
MTIGKNEKDSLINITFNIIKPKKISRFNIPIPVRTEASIAYLFLLKNPVNIIQIPKITENKDTKTILYSISKRLMLGPHTAFIQKE